MKFKNCEIIYFFLYETKKAEKEIRKFRSVKSYMFTSSSEITVIIYANKHIIKNAFACLCD